MDEIPSSIVAELLEMCWLAPRTKESEISTLCRKVVSSRKTIRCLIEQCLNIFHKMVVINDDAVAYLCCRSLHLLSILIYHMSSSLTGYEVTHIIYLSNLSTQLRFSIIEGILLTDHAGLVLSRRIRVHKSVIIIPLAAWPRASCSECESNQVQQVLDWIDI